MGYSLAVHVRNDRLAKRMLKFMGKEYRKWSVVTGSKSESVSTREISDDISYGQKKGVIGFDYASHCHGWERVFVYSLTRWVALKVGRMKRKFEMTESSNRTFVFPEPVPFISYDGCEDWPIIVVPDARTAMKVPEDRRWCCMDKFGVYVSERVNGSLAIHCEDLFFDKKVGKAFSKDLAKLGPVPAGDRSAYIKKHQALLAKHCKPEIDRMLPIVRKEVQRLDALWEASASPRRRG